MAKLGILASIATIVTAFAVATLPTSTASAGGTPCKAKEFKTVLVKAACEKGGQPEAKAAMKKFMHDHSSTIKSCKNCHSKLAPDYTLKPDAVQKFEKAGGKLLEGAKP